MVWRWLTLSFTAHVDTHMTASTAREVMHTMVLALAVLVCTGTAAIAQTYPGLPGVSETGIYITLPIYVSSLIAVGSSCFILGRWTTNVTRDRADLAGQQQRESKLLAGRIQQLEARLAKPDSNPSGKD